MRVPPTSPTNLAERHVQLSEFVDVSTHSMTDTQITTIIEPSMHAQRLERMMRTAEITTVPVARPPEEIPRCVRIYKRVFDSAYLYCGALSIPALALAAINPFLLVVPACLVVAAVACYFLRGKPTLEMEQEYETRRVSAQINDAQGV